MIVLFFDPPNAYALVRGEELLAHGHWSMAKGEDWKLAHRVRALLRENGWRTRNSNGGSGDGPVDICPECWARGER